MASSVSADEFAQLQAQLLATKAELYEAKERESRALRAADSAGEKAAAMASTLAMAEEARDKAEEEMAGVRSRGNSTHAHAATAAATGTAASAAEQADAAASGPTSRLSSLMSTVKRNSQSLGHAIVAAANSNPPATGASAAPAAASSDRQAEVSALKAQHARELEALQEEMSEQSTALKQNLSYLHQKTQELEKQNATLMSHLSNLEEERHSLAERREKELKRRQAKEAARAQRVKDGLPPLPDGEEEEEDMEAARAKWHAQREALEAQLATAQGELAKRDERITQLTCKVSDEEKNFERILLKLSEKDQELMHLRDELHSVKKSGGNASGANRNGPSLSPPAAAAGMSSPQKSPSSLRNFFNKGKEVLSPTAVAPQASPSPQPASGASRPAASPKLSAQGASANGPEETSLAASSADAPSEAASSTTAEVSGTTSSVTVNPAAASSGEPATPVSPANAAEPVPWSPSQPLAEQVTSLQAELAQLRMLNEHLISSVQKKDSLLTRNQDDSERIMARLAEKEMQIMQLRESQGSVEELQRELKKKDAALAKLQKQLEAAGTATAAAVSQAQSSSSTALELRAANEAIANMQAEFDSLKETLENCVDAADHELLTSLGFLSLDAVQQHFQRHSKLDVGCFVDGRLEFHAIAPTELTVHEGAFQFVRFQSHSPTHASPCVTKTTPHHVSLVVTDNHRMFGRLGRASHFSSEEPYTWAQEIPPELAVHTAAQVVAMGEAHEHALFQVATSFELGKEASGEPLSFSPLLGLESHDQVNAFLWMYGYWLGNGWLDGATDCIMFGPSKEPDVSKLDDIFARLPLPQLASISTGQHGYWRATSLSHSHQRTYAICSPNWWTLFSEQYPHKLDLQDSSSADRLWDWVFTRLNRREMRELLAGLCCAHGSEIEDAEQGGSISTSTARFRHEIERLCLMAGYSIHTSLNEQGRQPEGCTRRWSVAYTSAAEQAEVRLLVGKEVIPEPAPRHAKVWCVTVPTEQQLIMFRRVTERDYSGAAVQYSRPVVLGNTKDMLFLAETQLIDKAKLLGEQNDTLRELRDSADGHEATIRSLMAAKAKGERDMDEHVDYLEKKCLSEISEWERKYDADMAAAEEQSTRMQKQLTQARAEAQEARAEENAVRDELLQLRTQHDALVVSERTLSTSCEKLTRELSELRANSGIETKKRNQLVLELKAALKAELLRAKDALARLKNAEDDLVTMKVMQQHQIAPAGSFALTVDPAGAEAGVGGDNASSDNGVSAGRGNLAHASTTLHTPGSRGAAKGVEQEVANALAQKLAQLENDKFSLMKKLRALEEHNDLLQRDVMQKKEMVRNLVRRIESGALSSHGGEGLPQTQLFSTLTSEGRTQLFEKMEILLQETTLQNAQYKNNLQSMGAEMSKVMEDLDERTAELAAVREELDAAKDEQEIAQQSANDSLALMRSTEAQMKKLERSIAALCEQLTKRGVLDENLGDLEAELQTTVRQCIANVKSGGAARRLSNAAAVPPPAAAVSTPATSTSPAKATAGSSPVEKQQRDSAKAAAKAAEEAAKAKRAEEEDARIQRMQEDTARAQADEAEALRQQVDSERAQAAAAEEARRDALLAEADELSASVFSPASAARSSRNRRTTSQLLADPDLASPAAIKSPAPQQTAEE